MKRHSLMITTATLAAAMVLGTGCAKKPGVEASETVTSRTSVEGTAKTLETTVKAPKTAEQAAEAKEIHHMLQGTVTKVVEDGAVFTFQTDDGRNYGISQPDIRDVEVGIDGNVQIATAYIGEPLGKPEDVTLVVALPEREERSILTEKGTTTVNAMNSFTMRTDDGQKLSFLKDNYPIEEGALAGNGGDKVTVICVNSQGMNYPVKIKGMKQTGYRHSFTKSPCKISVFPVQSDIE